MSKRYLVDTNVLLEFPEILQEYDVVINSDILRELESLERKHDGNLKWKIRKAKKAIEDNRDKIFEDLSDYKGSLSGYDSDYIDNKIVAYAVDNGLGIISYDRLVRLKAEAYGVEWIDPSKNFFNLGYEGLVNFYYDDTNEEDVYIMNNIQLEIMGAEVENPNHFNLKINEYLIVWDKNKPTQKIDNNGKLVTTGYKELGLYKYNGKRLEKIKFSNIKNSFLGKVSPRNARQRLAFDMLQDDEITVKALFGVFGSGKDYLMLSHAINLVNEGKYDRIIWVRNNIEVKDTNSIGFLPDSLEDKLKPFLAPLQDFLGGEESLDRFIYDKKVEVQHLGFIRGRDIKNSIIYVTECQANTKEHIQLLLGRVGEGSQIWFNGDNKQTDGKHFEVNNGVEALKMLAGEKLYGQVTMDKTERSETARLAGLLDG